jgi:hypothetical protein
MSELGPLSGGKYIADPSAVPLSTEEISGALFVDDSGIEGSDLINTKVFTAQTLNRLTDLIDRRILEPAGLVFDDSVTDGSSAAVSEAKIENEIGAEAKEVLLGAAFGHTLLFATEKQAVYDNLVPKNESQNPYWSYEARRAGLTVGEWLRQNREIALEKLSMRKGDVDKLLYLGIVLQVTDLQTGVVVIGSPKSLNLKAAKITLEDAVSGSGTSLVYAQPKPVPDNAAQSYYGHELVVGFRVVTVPKENERYL